MEECHLALKDEKKLSTRKHLAAYGLQEVELQQEGRKLDAAGFLYVPPFEYNLADPTTPSLLSVGTPGDSQEVDCGVGRSGGLNDSRQGRKLQTSEGECEEGLHQWTIVGSGCP